MKKRVFSILLALCMAAGLMSVPALAAEEDTTAELDALETVETVEEVELSLDGDGEHSHNDIAFKALTGKVDFLTGDYCYYLTSDLTLTGALSVYGNITLCLNGCSIIGVDGKETIKVTSGATLTIHDCKGTGKITHNSGDKGAGVVNEGTLNLYSGNITGNTATSSTSIENSGGVINGGTFNMYGGKITNNTNADGRGGGVNNSKTFNMSGGTIGGTADEANSASHGGGVYNFGNGNPTFTMSGGSIIGNRVTGDGGGVEVDNGTFIMSGGSITDNSAKDGGGVYVWNGTFTMSNNAVISGNKATEEGGGVYQANNMTLSGTVNISGNKVGEADNNLCLAAGKTVTVDSLADSVVIGVSSSTAPTEGAPVAVTNAAADKAHFTADDSVKYEIGAADNKTVLQLAGTTPTQHTHSWGNWVSNGDGTHTRKCSGCTETETKSCSGGTASCTAKAVCSACNTAYGDKAAHNYNDTVNADYLKTPATCTADAVYYKSCSACHEKGTETFEAAGTKLAHTYVNTVGDNYLKEAATCTEDAVYYKSCKDCGAKSDTETFVKENSKLGHDFGGDYEHDETGHWQDCQREGCKGESTHESHSGDATCTEKAACKICKTEYLDPNSHSELKHVEAKAATKEAEGNVEYWHCEDCGKYFSDSAATKELAKADTVVARITDETKPEEKKDEAKPDGRKDETKKPPHTGDESALALWLMLTLAGSAALAAVVVSRKKSDNN